MSDPPTTTSSSTDLASTSCAYHNGSLRRPPNGSVSWCYETDAYWDSGIGSVTLCIDSAMGHCDVFTGQCNVSYSAGETSELTNHIRNIRVLDEGQLHLPESSFSDFLQGAEIRCEVLAEDGDPLPPCDVNFELLDRRENSKLHVYGTEYSLLLPDVKSGKSYIIKSAALLHVQLSLVVV